MFYGWMMRKSDESRKANEGHASSETCQAVQKSGPEIETNSLELVLERHGILASFNVNDSIELNIVVTSTLKCVSFNFIWVSDDIWISN